MNAAEDRHHLASEIGEAIARFSDALIDAGCTRQEAESANVEELARETTMSDGGVIVERAVIPTVVPAAHALSAEAERAARVMMRKSPQTLRTYQGIYTRFAAGSPPATAWLSPR